MNTPATIQLMPTSGKILTKLKYLTNISRIYYKQNIITPAIGGIYLPILKGNAKAEAQKLELIIEDFIEANNNILGDITVFITPNKNQLVLDHPKNWIEDLTDGFNHIQSGYDKARTSILTKNLTTDKEVQPKKFDFKFMPKSTIISKTPKYRIPGYQPSHLAKYFTKSMQTDKMDEKGKQKFTIINGKKRKMEESWGNNKYYFFFIKEII